LISSDPISFRRVRVPGGEFLGATTFSNLNRTSSRPDVPTRI
jgi:hypothetical protein